MVDILLIYIYGVLDSLLCLIFHLDFLAEISNFLCSRMVKSVNPSPRRSLVQFLAAAFWRKLSIFHDNLILLVVRAVRPHSGNLKIFPPRFFCKNFVKVTFLLKSYTVNWFHEKFLKWGKISGITTLWKSDKSSLTKIIIRQINSLVIYSVKRYFHEIFTKNGWERISVISTLC